jgi:MFS family permease
MTAPAPEKLPRGLVPIYLPTFLFSAAEGAIIPLLPAVAVSLGADLATGGLVAGAVMVGQLIADVPSSVLIARIGERNAMLIAAAASAAAGVVNFIAPNVAVLLVGTLVIGMSASVFAIARHTLLTLAVPLRYRARALSTLGGVGRGGAFLGPWVAALVVSGAPVQSIFLPYVGGCLIVLVVVSFLKDPAPAGGPHPVAVPGGVALGAAPLRVPVRTYLPALRSIGIATALLAGVRAAKVIVIPLWALHIGMDSMQTSIIVGIAGGAELLLFFAAGSVMDRFGRLGAAIPCLIGLSLGLALLPLTASFGSLLLVATFLGLANGIGSGLQLTLGADVAPRSDVPRFLGLWRLVSDGGTAAAPLVIAGVAATASLAAASGVMAAVGVVSLAMMWLYVPKNKPAGGSTQEATS